MNVEGVLRILAEIRNLDPRIGLRDVAEARAKAESWHAYLTHVDLEDGMLAVRNYYRIHRDDVIQVGDVQAGAAAVARDTAAGRGPRAELTTRRCPWPSFCSCTHERCTNGWLDDLMPAVTQGGQASEAAAVRCPTCASASELAAEAAGRGHAGRRR